MYSHFQQLRTIDAHTSALSNDFSRIDKVLKDLVMDISQSARPWSLLPDARITSGLGKSASLGDKDDMAIWELLFQLPCQPIRGYEGEFVIK
jgi:hypothetical protein